MEIEHGGGLSTRGLDMGVEGKGVLDMGGGHRSVEHGRLNMGVEQGEGG
jgi:hypothetical protein